MTRLKEYINKLLDPYKGLRKEIYILAISRFVNALGALIFPFMTLILSEKIGLGLIGVIGMMNLSRKDKLASS